MMIYLDFDGVILDTVSVILNLMNKNNLTFSDDCSSFFETLDWEYILNNSKEINNSINYIKKYKKIKNIRILTHVSSMKEMEKKIEFINQTIGDIEIICIPKSIKKSLVVKAKDNILIDDSRKNISDWENSGGKGILFDTKTSDLKSIIGE